MLKIANWQISIYLINKKTIYVEKLVPICTSCWETYIINGKLLNKHMKFKQRT